MVALAQGLSYVDLLFRGVPGIIATPVLEGPCGLSLIDPGPSLTLPTLEAELTAAGFSLSSVESILLTHVQLDHAGGVGRLVQRNPAVKVYVHQRGVSRLIDPSGMLASARRFYGETISQVWGDVLAVPPASIVQVMGGEEIAASGHRLRVACTPGHTAHHVSYRALDAGIAFVGDAVGVRLRPHGYAIPPTPPPDVDIDRWMDSLAQIAGWDCTMLFLAHFGPHEADGRRLREFGDNLRAAGAIARRSLSREGTDDERQRWFMDQLRVELLRHGSEEDVQSYQTAGRFDLDWRGLVRYWRRKAA
jgi:glyoxylase-like metal-dependent hydrolase (beta-lactamase superfamily II)